MQTLSMAIAGSVAGLIAAIFVKPLRLDILLWVVIGVICFTSVVIVRAAIKPKKITEVSLGLI